MTPLRLVLGHDPESQITGDGFYAAGKAVNTTFNQVLLDGRPLTTRAWTPSSVTALLPTGLDREGLEALGWRAKSDAELILRDDSGASSPAVKIDVLLPGQ